ncbi:hypothetical protein SE17_14575 [Kouleothrix aurantiaca]|jgi:hypothetical protein|uniref:LytR/CpsA/Psr regulator C-terminal domain-containing protein n=1 Tax=Kouleothrix aurantiaca TaxID=186479 RepID=A0A0P9FHJ1_9CHLR|nr:hypothetical protein SE17_14575 [Kouleothrix aurantiaca]
MGRRTLWLLLALPALLLALCSAGFARAWTQRGQELILPGAHNAEIKRTGLFKITASYELSDGRNVRHALQYMRNHGWKQIHTSNIERGVYTLVRSELSGYARDIVLLSVDDGDHTQIVVQYGRCFRSSWVTCV